MNSTWRTGGSRVAASRRSTWISSGDRRPRDQVTPAAPVLPANRFALPWLPRPGSGLRLPVIDRQRWVDLALHHADGAPLVCGLKVRERAERPLSDVLHDEQKLTHRPSPLSVSQTMPAIGRCVPTDDGTWQSVCRIACLYMIEKCKTCNCVDCRMRRRRLRARCRPTRTNP